jgi:adenine-specific DNA-methyltransferase
MVDSQISMFKEEYGENPRYLTDQIITYIGNKRSLLPFISEAVVHVKKELSKDKISCLDMFAGSGIVSRMMKSHTSILMSNDLETYSKVSSECYLTNKNDLVFSDLESMLNDLKDRIDNDPIEGFITEMYSPRDESNITEDDRVFYSRRNATYIDTARHYIGELPSNIQKYFLAPLIGLSSVHANTSGVFKGFYKSKKGVGQFGGSGRDALQRILAPIELCLPVLSNYTCEYHVFQQDSNQLSKDLSDTPLDLVYLDPPYNQHPYGSNYFMLNLICDYIRPSDISKVSGIPKSWNRSPYNKKKLASFALFDLIDQLNSKYVLVSYNSEGFVSQDEFLDVLSKMGNLTKMETKYNTFRGCRNLVNRSSHVTEYLYLLQKN